MADIPGHFRLLEARSSTGRRNPEAWTWTLTTDMGQTVAASGEFPDRATAERAIQWVKDSAVNCPVLGPPPN